MYDGRNPQKEEAKKEEDIPPELKKKVVDAIVELVVWEAVGNTKRFAEPMRVSIVAFSTMAMMHVVRRFAHSPKFYATVVEEVCGKVGLIK